MPDPRLIRIEDFDYPLPSGKIASFPLDHRDQSKLLIHNQGQGICQDHFSNLHAYLPENSLLVLNNTRVVQARLLFKKDTGANIEIFCLDPESPSAEINTAFRQASPVVWHCMVGNAKRWKNGRLELKDQIHGNIVLSAERTDQMSRESGVRSQESVNQQTIKLSWTPSELTFSEIINLFGHVPIPPYLNREGTEFDKARYQTIYAKPEGSVAAPTAGLHFTGPVFEKLMDKHIEIAYLTLHVGAGTFKPVTSESLSGHEMHAEQFVITLDLLKQIRIKMSGPVIAVGTTSVRSLESLYWLGLQVIKNPVIPEQMTVSQWEPYDRRSEVLPSAGESLIALISAMEKQEIDFIQGSTSLIIAPGYQFRLVKGMITNFHQPKSTLLLLISAFLGDQWREIYDYALDNEFRFLSYGDSCLFI